VKYCLLFLAAVPLFGGETVELASGGQLRAERHEVTGDVIRLFLKGGVTELPRTAVVDFVEDEVPPPTPEVAQPEPPPVPPAPPAVPKNPQQLVRSAALKAGLPPSFVESVARTESAMNPSAVSPKGAIGVMQLMPATARDLGADPHDLEQNIDAGTRLLRELLLRYDGDVVKALAAYNAGSGAVDKYQGLPPYPETQQYVNKVIKGYLDTRSATGAGQ
jgi:soluble lytic murein transglycosylase-like protein